MYPNLPMAATKPDERTVARHSDRYERRYLSHSPGYLNHNEFIPFVVVQISPPEAGGTRARPRDDAKWLGRARQGAASAGCKVWANHMENIFSRASGASGFALRCRIVSLGFGESVAATTGEHQ